MNPRAHECGAERAKTGPGRWQGQVEPARLLDGAGLLLVRRDTMYRR